MKAVIVEIKGEYASALSDDGCFSTIKNHDYATGQIIQLSRPKSQLVKKLSMLTASAAAVLILGVGTWAYASPYSYVSLDVNPSIEYIVNRFDRVLRVNAVNDDGEELLKEINLKELKNRSIQDALTETVEQIQEAGYFSGQEEGGIVIATSAQNTDKAEELALELQSAVEEEIVENSKNVTVETFSVTKDRVDQAKELGVTPGKLNLVEKLQESASGEDTIVLEEWLNKPVKDIMKATHNSKKGAPSSDNQDTETASETDPQSSNITNSTDRQTNPGKDKDKPDKNSGKDNGKPDKNAGKDNGKPDKSPDNGNGKPDKNSGNGNGKSDQNSGNDMDKPDKNPGNGIDHKPDKNSGNGNGKPDKGSGNGMDKSDENTGNGINKPDRNSGNGIDQPDQNSGNNNSGKNQSKTDKVTAKGKGKSDKGSAGNQKKK